MRGRARGLGVPAAVVGLLALSGCTVTGDAVVGPDSVTVDLQIEHAAPFSSSEGYVRSGPCDGGSFLPGLDMTPLAAAEGRRQCTVTGTVPIPPDGSDWSEFVSFFITRTNDAVLMRIPPGWPGDPQSEDLDAIDVTVRFPGEVITSNANDFGPANEVRWTDPARVGSEGMAAVARLGIGLPSWMVPTAVGVLVGAAAVLVGPRALHRFGGAQPDAQADAAASGDEPDDKEPGPGPVPVEDPGVWARED